MSVIRADLVGPSLGGTTRTLVRGTAAAWVNFNGTGTIAARDSENVSSLTDNGVGIYTVNINSEMANADYAAVAAGTESQIRVSDNAVPTTSSTRVLTAGIDSPYVSYSNFGDLA